MLRKFISRVVDTLQTKDSDMENLAVGDNVFLSIPVHEAILYMKSIQELSGQTGVVNKPESRSGDDAGRVWVKFKYNGGPHDQFVSIFREHLYKR